MCSASRKCTAQFQGFAIISRYKVTYWGPKMTRESIESFSCSKEGCLHSIERLKAQPASLQWDLHVTSGDHFEAAKSCTTETFYAMFLWTLRWRIYTCLCVSIVFNLKNIFFHVLIVVVFKFMRNTNCFTIILSCIAVSNRRCDPAVLPFLFWTNINAPF